MQNEKYSEEYYKMKYFKYRAKYEQLKEFAEQSNGQQGGSFLGFGKKKDAAAPVQQPGQPVQQPVQPVQQPGQPAPAEPTKSKFSFFGKKDAAAPSKTSKPSAINPKDLMVEVANFLTKGLPEGKEKWVILAKLEQPCTYKQIRDLVEKKQVDKSRSFLEVEADLNLKQKLLGDINKTCSTTMGGLNALCVYQEPVATVTQQPTTQPTQQPTQQPALVGGYSDSPYSLDDLSTEF